MAQRGVAGASAGSAPLVSVRDVTRIYGAGHSAVTALQGVTLDVPTGAFVAVTGRSGSGKTTLLNLIGGLDTPTQGTILLGGRDITGLDEQARTALRRHDVAFVFQSFALLPTFSALENVALALHIAGVGARERLQRARQALALVGLSARLDHRPFELSGGEQERVAVARALANRPQVILADEPTGELDTATGRELIALLAHVVAAEGVTLIVATHDAAVTAAAHLVYHIADGRVHAVEAAQPPT